MRRTPKAFAAAAMVAALLTGCSSSESNTLTFWNPLTGDDGAYMRQIVQDYNATKPQYPVTFQPMAEADLYTKVYSVVNAEADIPDVMIMHAARIPEFAGAGVLTTDETLTAAQPQLKRDNYQETAWDAGTVGGKSYGIPLDLHGVIMYYNKDLVAKYDAEDFLDDKVITLDELATLKGKLPPDTYAFAGLFIPGVVDAGVRNLGGSAEPQPGKVEMTSPQFTTVYSKLVQLQKDGLIAPEDSDSMQVFNSGKALFLPDGTWGLSGHRAIKGLNFGLTNALQMSPDKPVNVLGSHQFVQLKDGNRGKERDKAVAAFVEFVRKNSLKWADSGQIPASRQVFESPEYAKYPQSFLTATSEQQSMLKIDATPHAGFISGALWTHSKDIVWGRVPVAQGLETMQKEIEAKIAEADAAGTKRD
ncbi:extracellular solute-binding protein [Nonomuraea sp. NPDC003709]|uniref:extracellular solute-binding protein n=1 Tax=Nonomuraea sp. NPDC003709 TaxID=3154450 RepID=UPI0033B2887B